MYIVIAVSAVFAATIFDIQFIVIQRYNRPRIMRLLEKQKSVRKEHTVG